MKNNLTIKIVSLALLVLMMLSVFTGCTPEGKDLLMGFVQEWINTKFGIDTTDNSLIGKLTAGAKLVKLFTEDSTGNPDADAALGTVKMVKNFQQAESAMELGIKTDNATAMDQAIALRPGDWSYRASRCTLALKQNQLEKGRDEWDKGRDLAYNENNTSSSVRFYSQSINELEAWKNTGKLDKTSDYQQAFAYGTLISDYAGRYRITKNPKDKEMALYYNTQWNHVAGLYPGKPPDLDLDN
jgi:hypothetical protein